MARIVGNLQPEGVKMRLVGGWLLFLGMSMQIVYNVVMRPDLPIRMLVYATAFVALLLIMQGFFKT